LGRKVSEVLPKLLEQQYQRDEHPYLGSGMSLDQSHPLCSIQRISRSLLDSGSETYI